MKLRALAGALALFVLGGTSHACAQMVSRPATGAISRAAMAVTYGWMSHVSGFTFCLDGTGYSFISANQSGLDRVDTEAHEAKHREQFSRYPSCEAFDAATSSLTQRVLVEAEAYAAGLCAQLAAGSADPKLSLERDYAERISYWVTRGQVMPYNILPIIQAYETC